MKIQTKSRMRKVQPERKLISEQKADALFVSQYSSKPMLAAVLMSRTKRTTRKKHGCLKKLGSTLMTTVKANSNFFKSPYVA